MTAITFRVNLETVGTPGFLQPNRTTLDGNETVTEASCLKNTRTLYIPGLLNSNYAGVGPNATFDPALATGYLNHGETFTVTGMQAVYLKKTYVSTPAAITDVLQIVSQNFS